MSAIEDADQIEITREMLDAGADIVWGYQPDFDTPRETAEKVFRAMTSARASARAATDRKSQSADSA
jgi:hypothetical protein